MKRNIELLKYKGRESKAGIHGYWIYFSYSFQFPQIRFIFGFTPSLSTERRTFSNPNEAVMTPFHFFSFLSHQIDGSLFHIIFYFASFSIVKIVNRCSFLSLSSFLSNNSNSRKFGCVFSGNIESRVLA